MQFKLLLKVHQDNNDLNEEELKILLPLVDRLIKIKKTNIIFRVLQHRLTIENNQFVLDKEAKDILTVACEKHHKELIEFIFKNYQNADAVENIPLYIKLLIDFAQNNSSESYRLLSSLIPLSPLELVTLPLITLLSKQLLDDKKNLDNKAIQFLLQHGCRVTATSFMKMISRNIDMVAEDLIQLFIEQTDDLTIIQAAFDKYLLTAFKLKWFVMPQQIPSVEDFIKIIVASTHQRNPTFSNVIKKFIEKKCQLQEFLNSYRNIALTKKIVLASSVDAILNPLVNSNLTAENKLTSKLDDDREDIFNDLYKKEIEELCEKGIYGCKAEVCRRIVNLSIQDVIDAAEHGNYILINDFIKNHTVMHKMFDVMRGNIYKLFYDYIIQRKISINFLIKAYENNCNELPDNLVTYAFHLDRCVRQFRGLKDQDVYRKSVEEMLESAFVSLKFLPKEEFIEKFKLQKGLTLPTESETFRFHIKLILYPQLQKAINGNDIQWLNHLLQNYADILALTSSESKQLAVNPHQNKLHETVNLDFLSRNLAFPHEILYSNSSFSFKRKTNIDNTDLKSKRRNFLKHAFIMDRFIKAYRANILPEIVSTLIGGFPGIEELVIRFLVTQPDSSAILKYLVERGIQPTEECVTLAFDKGYYTYAVILAGTSVLLQKKISKLSNAQQMADAWGLTVQEYMDYQFKGEHTNFYGYSEAVADDILPFIQTATQIEQNHGISDGDKDSVKHLAILFGSLENALKYFEEYTDAHADSHQPIHDACLFQVPQKGLWHIPIWRKLIFKYGDTLIRFVRLAPAIEALLYGDDIPLSLLRNNLEKQYRNDFYEKFKLHFAKIYDTDLTHEKLLKINNEHRQIAVARVAAKYKNKQLSDAELQALIQEEMSLLQKKLQDEREGYIQQQTENQIKLMVAKELENQLLAKLQKICLFITHNDAKHELQRIDLVNLSLSAIKEFIAKICYKRGEESPELAIKCITAGLDERLFEYALGLKKTFKTHDYLPDVFIDGSDVGEPHYYMEKLPVDDDRGLMLGIDTNSCQYLGGQATDVAVQGKTSLFGTFYVIMKKPLGATELNKYKNEIFGQCYTWISSNGNICFCSLEARRPQLGIKFVKFYEAAAKKLIGQKVMLPSGETDAEGNLKLITKEIQRVTVGQGGGTPKEMEWPVATNPEVPIAGEVAHPDSNQQWILADKAMEAELESKPHKALRPPLSQ